MSPDVGELQELTQPLTAGDLDRPSGVHLCKHGPCDHVYGAKLLAPFWVAKRLSKVKSGSVLKSTINCGNFGGMEI